MDALLVSQSALTHGFSGEGKLVTPVEFLVTGDLSACMVVFHTHALHAFILESNQIALQPEQKNKRSQPLQSSSLPTSIYLQPERLLFMVVLIHRWLRYVWYWRDACVKSSRCISCAVTKINNFVLVNNKKW